MNRLIALSLVLALIVLGAISIPAPKKAMAEAPIAFFKGWSTTGAGTASTTPQTYKTWSCQVNTTGNPSSVIVGLQGNIKGTKYDDLAWHTFTADELTNGQALFYPAVDKPLVRFRGNVKALGWTTAGTLDMYCVGVR